MMYRILWQASFSSASRQSPFVFDLLVATKLVKRMQKICKKTFFAIQEDKDFLDCEIYPDYIMSTNERLIRFRQMESARHARRLKQEI